MREDRVGQIVSTFDMFWFLDFMMKPKSDAPMIAGFAQK